MRHLLLPLIALLGGCQEWERPGATPQMRDAALASCRAAAFAKAEPELRTVMTDPGGWVPPREECRGRGEDRRCRTVPGYHRSASYGTRDQNAPMRDAIIEDCMRRDGWVLR
ncbi:hypothetical protein [Muricoccus radiodurans]|uniref:hypothetical protein n=1 Tax=Muricoccus radiodurans TaxID=2231721 RepID=UPI003CEFF860